MITREEAKQVLEEFEEYLFKSDGFDTWWMSSAIKTFIELSDYADSPEYVIEGKFLGVPCEDESPNKPMYAIPVNDIPDRPIDEVLDEWRLSGQIEAYRIKEIAKKHDDYFNFLNLNK